METTTPTLVQIVELLLWPCWKGSSDSYKAKYARTIWQQFEEGALCGLYSQPDKVSRVASREDGHRNPQGRFSARQSGDAA